MKKLNVEKVVEIINNNKDLLFEIYYNNNYYTNSKLIKQLINLKKLIVKDLIQ